MRVILSVVAILAVPALAACATAGGPSQYQQDIDRLEAGCRERGGILTPTGAQTGRPETEYACRITGGATRLD